MARRYWRTGLAEVYRDLSRRAFVAACQRFVPELRPDDVVPGPSGVRAQSVDRDGRLLDDFWFDRQGPQLQPLHRIAGEAKRVFSLQGVPVLHLQADIIALTAKINTTLE